MRYERLHSQNSNIKDEFYVVCCVDCGRTFENADFPNVENTKFLPRGQVPKSHIPQENKRFRRIIQHIWGERSFFGVKCKKCRSL